MGVVGTVLGIILFAVVLYLILSGIYFVIANVRIGSPHLPQTQWTTLFQRHLSDPPAWLSLGLGNYTLGLEANLAARVMETNNMTLAVAVVKNYTSYVGGLTLTGFDYVSFGSLSGLKA